MGDKNVLLDMVYDIKKMDNYIWRELFTFPSFDAGYYDCIADGEFEFSIYYHIKIYVTKETVHGTEKRPFIIDILLINLEDYI